MKRITMYFENEDKSVELKRTEEYDDLEHSFEIITAAVELHKEYKLRSVHYWEEI